MSLGQTWSLTRLLALWPAPSRPQSMSVSSAVSLPELLLLRLPLQLTPLLALCPVLPALIHPNMPSQTGPSLALAACVVLCCLLHLCHTLSPYRFSCLASHAIFSFLTFLNPTYSSIYKYVNLALTAE